MAAAQKSSGAGIDRAGRAGSQKWVQMPTVGARFFYATKSKIKK